MRDERHYRRMLDENPHATINVPLAASMVYAARHGICEPADRGEEWAGLVRQFKATYGENLDAEQIRQEMDRAHDQA